MADHKTIPIRRKQIMVFMGRAYPTIQKRIDGEDFPAQKLDGVWKADVE